MVAAEPATGLTNAISITSAPSAVTCSFAGGCSYSVPSPGLTSRVASGKSEIVVCRKPCIFDSANSDATQTTCLVPSIQSTASNALFEMTKEGEVRGSTRTSFPLDLVGVVFDGKNLPAIAQTTTAECYVKMQMDEGYVATLSAFKMFMQYFPDIANYEDLLVLQGSNDDFATTPTEILKIDSSLHEGWNYYDLSQNPPTFSHYRL